MAAITAEELEALQATLARTRDKLLASLDIDDGDRELDEMAAVAAAARSRKADPAKRRRGDDVGVTGEPTVLRRSLRNQKIRAEEAAASGTLSWVDLASAAAVAADEEDGGLDRPEGNVPWFDCLDVKQQEAGAAAVMDVVRACIAEWTATAHPPRPVPTRADFQALSAVPAGEVVAIDEAAANDESAPRRRPSRTAGAVAAARLASDTPARPPQRATSGAAASSPAVIVVDGDGEGGSGGGSDDVAAVLAAVAADERVSQLASLSNGGLTANLAPTLGLWPLPAGDAAAAPSAATPSRKRSSSSSAAAATSARSGGAGVIPAAAIRRPASALAGLHIASPRHVLKVMPDRVYSLTVHPAPHRTIIIAGGKFGRLAVWCPPDVEPTPLGWAEAMAAADDEDGEGEGEGEGGASPPAAKRARRATASPIIVDDASSGTHAAATAAAEPDDPNAGVAVFKPHAQHVTYVSVPRGAPHLIMTSSYDGTLRALDLNAGVSWHVSPGLTPTEAYPLSAFDAALATADPSSRLGVGITMVAGTQGGNIILLDSRSGDAGVSFAAHRKRVSAVSSCGDLPHLVLSASSDGTIKLWDDRKWAARHVLAEGSNAASITSAFFSAHGNRIVGTAADDLLRLWDVRDAAGPKPRLEASRSIKHNNHTGRWLSPFRAVFDAGCEETMVVGSMSREVEGYDVTNGRRLFALTSPLLTAVPSLNAVHPCPAVGVSREAARAVGLMASGTASGRLHVWTAPADGGDGHA